MSEENLTEVPVDQLKSLLNPITNKLDTLDAKIDVVEARAQVREPAQ